MNLEGENGETPEMQETSTNGAWEAVEAAAAGCEAREPKPRPVPERALSAPERQQVLDVLHSERFATVSPEKTWATLLDEGTYLRSTRTMYRVLAAHHDGVPERRNQPTHSSYVRPELAWLPRRSGSPRKSGQFRSPAWPTRSRAPRSHTAG